ncbi:uncharacterized protein AMSG_06565 [Thecamonas trahens ATCC 50062]|uniref:Uncharacterized protein n=1 Tax=Thecamonas trahens ATCC 50062 TaxID=461836 RepID=A0A0L0DIQ3_THETB|nr:hypothetical protein AMSG_06565 [Thecamonas trahens ATCC 50062]KNC51208.1 hypothetical protein AMSG_06565 [Thecamonas trahens ATCC 50062]|eukprot:XP_013756405.1 hypothetical protein AMSG_06565 [Thecamonas trahens ATCC 50062]
MTANIPQRTPLEETLVVHPTAEEFADPLAYIASIAHRRSGPSTVFLDKIRVFHAARGRSLPTTTEHGKTRLTLPIVDGSELDLFSLFRTVVAAGGPAALDADPAGWRKLADTMALHSTSAAVEIRHWYGIYLAEYVRAYCTVIAADKAAAQERRRNKRDRSGSASGSASPPGVEPGAKRAKGLGGEVLVNAPATAALASADGDAGNAWIKLPRDASGAVALDERAFELESANCSVAETKAAAKFAFRTGGDYTLTSFRAMDVERRERLFGRSRSLSIPELESMFWKVIEDGTMMIDAEYGADLDVRQYGSGFPKHGPYGSSGWNLNVMPTLPGSLLSLLEDDIVGVTIPWFYVGSTLSTFCWHTEDNYLYSINYLHLGMPKIWYGIPSSGASAFENAIRTRLSHEFEAAPELIHHLTTQMSPFELRDAGVPVYRTTHHPGQFVITFPQAYHAGFNAGFNAAEAVNFALPDWLPFGYSAILKYAPIKREPIFAFEHVALKVAVRHGRALSLKQRAMLAEILDDAVSREERLREAVVAELDTDFVLDYGPTNVLFTSPALASRSKPAQDPDDEEFCSICKRFVPFSLVYCGTNSRVICPEHHSFSSHPFKQPVARYAIADLKRVVASLRDTPADAAHRAAVAAEAEVDANAVAVAATSDGLKPMAGVKPEPEAKTALPEHTATGSLAPMDLALASARSPPSPPLQSQPAPAPTSPPAPAQAPAVMQAPKASGHPTLVPSIIDIK